MMEVSLDELNLTIEMEKSSVADICFDRMAVKAF